MSSREGTRKTAHPWSTFTKQEQIWNLRVGARQPPYFRDILAEVVREIMDEMLTAKPEPELSGLESMDDWLNRHNVARTIPEWYEAVGEFLSDVRCAYR